MKPSGEALFLIRAARAQDVPAVAAISARCPAAAGWTPRQFEEELRSVNSLFIVAERGGRVAGYAVLWIVGEEAQILDVAVDPACRRRGVGRALFSELSVRARAARCVKATLEASARNEPALGLYRRLGFRVVGRRAKFYNDGADAVLMDLSL